MTQELSTTDLNAKQEDKGGEGKVSKAQKRRDKKAQKEKERLAEIEKQDELNKTGARQVEIDRITNKLEKRGLRLHSIPSDGDCLFASVAHQLQISG